MLTDRDHPASDTALRLAPLLDATALLTAGYAAWWSRFGQTGVPPHYLIAMVLGLLLGLALLPTCRAYRSAAWRRPVPGVVAAVPGLIAVFGSLMLLAALTKTTSDFSRLWMGGWTLLTLVLMGLWRLACIPVTQPRHRRVLLLGSGTLASRITLRLDNVRSGVEIVGCIALPEDLMSPGVVAETDQASKPVLGTLNDLDEILARGSPPIDELWLAPDRPPDQTNEALITRLRMYSLPVHYVPNMSVLQLWGQRASEVAGMTMIELNATPLDGPDALLKTVMDRVLSALLLVMLSPLLLLIALLIRLDSRGPALFRQPRHGSGGQVIQVFKFRTMFHHDHPEDHRQARRDDPRVTRIGAFLRRNSLDELPQLINVLRGDMSLVGPRPHPVALNQEYAILLQDYMQRHRVLPGITGWAQVNGYRGETDTLEKMAGRLEHDLYYIEHWSLGLDLRILVRTALLGWGDRNAY